MGVAGNGTLTLRQAQKLELAYKRTCTAEAGRRAPEGAERPQRLLPKPRSAPAMYS